MVPMRGITGILAALVFLSSPGLTKQLLVSTYSQNPCGAEPASYVVVDAPIHNHYAETALKMTRLNLKMALDDFYYLNKTKLVPLYSGRIVTPSCTDHSLPHRQYWEYFGFKRAHRNNMTSELMVHHTLPKLLNRLTIFGKAFDMLSEMADPNVNNTEEILHERRWIIRRLKAKLRSLCCEIETSINISDINKTTEVNPALYKVGNDWPRRLNLTMLLTRDMSTFMAYKIFLEESYRIQLDLSLEIKHSRHSHDRFRQRILPITAKRKVSARKERRKKPGTKRPSQL